MQCVVEPLPSRQLPAGHSWLEVTRRQPSQSGGEQQRQHAQRRQPEQHLGDRHLRAAAASAARGVCHHGQCDQRYDAHQPIDQHRGHRLRGGLRPPPQLHRAHGVAADRGRQELTQEQRHEVRARQPRDRHDDALGAQQHPPPPGHHGHGGDIDDRGRCDPAKVGRRKRVPDLCRVGEPHQRRQHHRGDDGAQTDADAAAHFVNAPCSLRRAASTSSTSAAP